MAYCEKPQLCTLSVGSSYLAQSFFSRFIYYYSHSCPLHSYNEWFACHDCPRCFVYTVSSTNPLSTHYSEKNALEVWFKKTDNYYLLSAYSGQGKCTEWLTYIHY